VFFDKPAIDLLRHSVRKLEADEQCPAGAIHSQERKRRPTQGLAIKYQKMVQSVKNLCIESILISFLEPVAYPPNFL
jgi:hypothetical protein